MNYIVLDMEWNQPRFKQETVKKPVELFGEIIQIGAVKLDENFNLVDTFKIMVSPKYYKKMHKTVAKITKITTEQLQYGFPFPVAFNYFRKWCGDEFSFLIWGFDDVDMLRSNMILHKMDESWIPETYNVQVIFDNQVLKENRQIALFKAMEMLDEPALEAHDALHDAKNTARVCLHLDMEKGIAEYHETEKYIKRRAEIKSERVMPDKVYKSKMEAMSDPETTRFYFAEKNEYVTCIDVVRQNDAKFMAIAKCDSGEEFFIRFKFTKWDDGIFSYNRIIYELTEKNRSYFNSKKQKTNNYYERLCKAG